MLRKCSFGLVLSLLSPFGGGCRAMGPDGNASAPTAHKAIDEGHALPGDRNDPAREASADPSDAESGPETAWAPSARAPFEGATRVSVDDLVAELREVATALESTEVVRREHLAFLSAHDLDEDTVSLETYSKVRLAFEATRDGGLWGLRWDITNRKPRSDEIWSQWLEADLGELDVERWSETAVAECDELSALFAFVARRLGVEDIGLFWPTGNHTVAVWTVAPDTKRPIRLVVPTSQIYLSAEANLGTQEFNAYSQKTIFEYRRDDVEMDFEIPAPLARHFVLTARRYAAMPAAQLQQRRHRHGGS